MPMRCVVQNCSCTRADGVSLYKLPKNTVLSRLIMDKIHLSDIVVYVQDTSLHQTLLTIPSKHHWDSVQRKCTGF